MAIAPTDGPCSPWADALAVDDCDGCADLDAYILDEMLEVSSNILYRLSGRQYSGECTDTIRPCGLTTGLRNIASWGYANGLVGFPGGFNGSWGGFDGFGVGACGCDHPVTRMCGCDEGPSQFPLPNYPVTAVSSVIVDGTALPADEYRVDDWRWLVRLPNTGETGRRQWPCCQRLDQPSTADHTMQVTYTWGTPVPADGVRACAELACELAKACTGGACKLPVRATQITRENLSISLISDVDAILRQGKTGLYFTDLFLASVNPNNIRSGAEVISPDLGPIAVRSTWP